MWNIDGGRDWVNSTPQFNVFLQCSEFSIPDLGSKRFRIRIKEFKHFKHLTMKTVSKLSDPDRIWDVHPGSRIRIQTFFHPGSRKQKAPDPGFATLFFSTVIRIQKVTPCILHAVHVYTTLNKHSFYTVQYANRRIFVSMENRIRFRINGFTFLDETSTYRYIMSY